MPTSAQGPKKSDVGHSRHSKQLKLDESTAWLQHLRTAVAIGRAQHAACRGRLAARVALPTCREQPYDAQTYQPSFHAYECMPTTPTHLAEGQCSQHWWCAASTCDCQERCVHGTNVCCTRGEEVVAVEVEHQDDAKGRLPGQTQATHDVNHAGGEPGDESKLHSGRHNSTEQTQNSSGHKTCKNAHCKHSQGRTRATLHSRCSAVRYIAGNASTNLVEVCCHCNKCREPCQCVPGSVVVQALLPADDTYRQQAPAAASGNAQNDMVQQGPLKRLGLYIASASQHE